MKTQDAANDLAAALSADDIKPPSEAIAALIANGILALERDASVA